MTPHSEFRNPKYEEMIGFTREALGLPESVSIEISPMEGRGSDRSFSRLRWDFNHSAILIHYDPERVENSCYADIAVFLHNINIPVPQLIRHDSVRCLILIEDLGDKDLWSLRKIPWETRRTLYQKTLAIAHRLHSFPEKDFPSARVSLMEDFGPGLYRWEQDYFREHLVRGVCGINLEPSFEEELEEDLSALAARLSEIRRSLVHRDLQSRNVMIRDGEPYLIDFQGMRFGTPFYDLGSLLCDPYVEFDGDQRTDLLLYYYNLSKQDLGWEDFQKMFWEASAQRLMQALGAYGFLGLKKGLKAFLEHIPAGLQHLLFVASQISSLPHLSELSSQCHKAIAAEGR
jgi:aminoglycoside/choline kinase family phosphotransferase